jgi:toxin secretion/phage lysis holin
MKDLIMTTKIIWTAIGACLGGLLGGMDGMLYALIAFVTVDYMTGVIAAVYEKKLSSEIGYRGILKKFLVFVIVALANIIDVHLIGNGSAIRTAIIFYFVYNEGISILENVSRTGLKVSPKLKEILEQLGGDKNDGDEV